VRPEPGSFPDVSERRFYFGCAASASVALPAEWVTEMLADGEIALVAGGGSFATITDGAACWA
jgi:hypothetical protein